MTTRIFANMFTDTGLECFGHADVHATVFSGKSDTTFGNTFLMCCVFRYVLEVHLGLTKDEYGLKVKGDDATVFIPKRVTIDQILNAFDQVMYTSKYIKHVDIPLYVKHGLGLVLKYSMISDDTSDIDFCSTNTFYCETCQHHRITRKIDRFLYLTPWSSVITKLPYKKRNAYLHNLYVANLQWMDGLPIFSQLNDKTRTNDLQHYSLVGPTRKVLPVTSFDQVWEKRLFGKSVTNVARQMAMFGKEDYYKFSLMKSNLSDCCRQSYYTWLETHLGLSRTEVNTICDDISNATGDHYISELLSEGLRYLTRYVEARCFTI